MPLLNHTDEPERDRQEHFEHEHDWLCARCFKTISADRPPVLNLDNCSCQEAGRRANDPNSAPAAAGFLNDSNGQGPPSYPTSTDGSVDNPNGPVAQDPNNRFLLVAPAVGLGEVQHRRRASSDYDEQQRAQAICQWRNSLPLQDRRFHGAMIDTSEAAWLRQNTYIIGHMDSVEATRGGSRTASLMLSSRSSGTSSGWLTTSIEPVLGAGAWMDTSVSGGWPEHLDEDTMYDDDI